eukprot:TRINITY_DN3685_c0_g1_i1.p1 TRINITY_DN3685_c0_g1~~TRINITY_DN3685_c0_g1_i1.p1  ORF type:complete len:386 (+),score=86.29 TRINITY_DN3685_c0_g1_i1:90-1247(+)
MGNTASLQEQVSQHKSGYHILQVLENSPSEGVLIPYFDFVVGVLSQNGPYLLTQEGIQLSDIFKSHIDQALGLLVYNLASGQIREARIVPSNTWGGNGLVGISIRWSSFSKTLDLVWHVLEMEENSPAAQSELVSMTDYIIGSPSVSLPESESFFQLLQDNIDREIFLYVYSSVQENVRVVSVIPKNNWGGKGVLGCGIGTGLLHRPPPPKGISKGVPLSQTFIPLQPSSPHPTTEPTIKTTTTEHILNDPFQTPQKQQPVNNDITPSSPTEKYITNTSLLDNSLEFSSFVQSNIPPFTPIAHAPTSLNAISPITSKHEDSSTHTPMKIPFLPLDTYTSINTPVIISPTRVAPTPTTPTETENSELQPNPTEESLSHEFQQVELK